MPFDFADLKAMTRRVVHDTLGVSAFYQDDTMSAPMAIKARYLSQKIDRFGDLAEQGYAEMVMGVDRVVVFPGDTPSVMFKHNGIVEFPKYGLSFRLEVLEPATGSDQAVWQVAAL